MVKQTTTAGQVAQDLDGLAMSLAVTHGAPVSGTWVGARAPQQRVDATQRTFRQLLNRAALRRGPDQRPADEWMLDNAHVVEGALRQIRRDLPAGFVRVLPGLPAGGRRIQQVASALLEVQGGSFEVLGSARFLMTYQQLWPLTLGEDWALPAFLRLETLTGLLAAAGSSDARVRDAGVAQAVQTLRGLGHVDWRAFVEGVSVVEAALKLDPAGVYAGMDGPTRDQYRRAVERLARAARRPEVAVAQAAVALAAGQAPAGGEQRAVEEPGHVGAALLARPTAVGVTPLEQLLGYRPGPWVRLRRALGRAREGAYFTALFALAVLTLMGLLGVAVRAGAAPWAVLILLLLTLAPALVNAATLLNWASSLRPPRALPKMDGSRPVPDGSATLVVVPCLLTDVAEIDSLLDGLERHGLSNGDEQVSFALLSDFVDAPHEVMPADAALLAHVQAGIAELNARHGDHYFLFHRPRRFSAPEGCWMGWERKRGKLMDLNSVLLQGDTRAFSVPEQRPARLANVRYVLTLDADTWLPPGGVRTMVATFNHPENRPAWNARGRLRAGFTVLQPRMEPHPRSVEASAYVRALTGRRGLDLYGQAVSEAYQDLFGNGIYAGKGLYDVAAFDRCVRGQVPPGQVLSHDLLEGALGRVAWVSDLTLIEASPSHYLAFTRRLERWVRGDWQLLPWLGRRGVALGNLGRWKILHNLLRSLHPPGVLGVLSLAWAGVIGEPLFWTLLALLALTAPLLVSGASGLLGSVRVRSSEQLLTALREEGRRTLLTLAFLPYESLVILGAAARAVNRTVLTRRRLLEWTPAAQVSGQLAARGSSRACWQAMWGAPVVAVALGVASVRAGTWVIGAPLLLTWLGSPQLAWLLSRPFRLQRPDLSAAQRSELRRLARRTWLFFERFVGPDDHWLPPDHFQEQPLGTAVHRTSPTNIGLLLGSTLSAYDLGYLGPLELTLRLRATLDTLARLERHEGHLLNWYDTHSLSPLAPPYVSTVDSGNLIGCLIALRQGVLTLPDESVWRAQGWEGLLDTVALLDGALPAGEGRAWCAQVALDVRAALPDPDRWNALLMDLSGDRMAALEAALMHLVEAAHPPQDEDTLWEVSTWLERTRHHLQNLSEQRDWFMPWLTAPPAPPGLPVLVDLPAAPRLRDLPAVYARASAALDEAERQEVSSDVRSWCAALRATILTAAEHTGQWLREVDDLARCLNAEIEGARWAFLFDEERQVFRLGYRPDLEQPDPNAYDLLASEARLASFVAVSLRQVPPGHWLHLARPMRRVAGRRLLLSWSGTAFEYLMPALLMRAPPDTLLGVACASAVDTQRAYGRHHGVPWGVSESGFYRFDAGLAYQYRAFGVPGLGLQRGLGEDLVVTPYASLLALPWRPAAVSRNLPRLQAAGLLGRYGYFEAADYTPGRVPVGARAGVVRSYMAHHQGMVLLSLGNALATGVPGRPSMVDRFHADPRVAGAELLLYEQVPYAVPLERLHLDERRAAPGQVPGLSLAPWSASPGAASQLHLLANGRYSVVISGTGGGASRWQSLQLSRFRADPVLQDCGHWLYLQDEDTGERWSLTRQPFAEAADQEHTLFSAHSAQFHRRAQGVTSLLEVTVDPRQDVEVRRVTLRSDGLGVRRLRLTCLAEAALAPGAADLTHPAFHKLFVESEWVGPERTLLLRRRRRGPQDAGVWWGHLLVQPGGFPAALAWDGSRREVLGRHGAPRHPRVLRGLATLTGTVGTTLDSVACLQAGVTLRPGQTVTLAWVAVAAPKRAEALALARRFAAWPRIEEAFHSARSETHRALRAAGLGTPELELGARLLSALLYPRAEWRADAAERRANTLGQRDLWPLGVSGDHPILLLELRAAQDTELLSALLRLHRHWRERDVTVDLVLLNTGDQGYGQDVTLATARLVTASGADSWLGRPGGVFMLRASALSHGEQRLLRSSARVTLCSADGPLATQLRPRPEVAELPPLLPARPAWTPAPQDRPPEPALTFWNGLGGFTPPGDEYHIHLSGEQVTPRPWVNVIASPHGGCMISESGSRFSWAGNSGENRLTSWTNDPVSDRSAETLYLRDEDTAQVWTPTPQPTPAGAPYLVRHGWGYTTFEHDSHGLRQRLRVYTAPEDPVNVITLTLTNAGVTPRHLSVTYAAEWVLGPHRDGQAPHLIPDYAAEHGALLIRNPWRDEYRAQVAFLAAVPAPHGVTADRAEFLGQGGDPARPAALKRVGLSGLVEPGGDPGAALQVPVHLPGGAAQEITFLVGAGTDAADAVRLLRTYRDPARLEHTWQAARAGWQDLLGRVKVQTPDPSMDLLLNGWLLYQTLSCRVWGRSALYQSSGAFGFRDQLQDVLALLHAAPHLARAQILQAAARQFAQGDVLHWWHPPLARGVRTRMSDDLLWLPYVTARYVTATGDTGILQESVPFLSGAELGPQEHERYDTFADGPAGSLFEHLLRAVRRASTAGLHGLPLMGTGDWNDGMNLVGAGGKGESVWLGWFLHCVLTSMIPLCRSEGDEAAARTFEVQAQALRGNLELHAWDGDWYLRAFHDDGTPLGAARNRECRIDALSQAWAVLSGAAEPDRARHAMQAVRQQLLQEWNGLSLLLTPPFDRSGHHPGYIQGYPPGIRENGGQYSHAAVWTAWAFADLGDAAQAHRLFQWLSPPLRAATPAGVATYQTEPYVMTADVASHPQHRGEGGWSWYTGSAAWMYRLGLERLLGIQRVGASLHVRPCIPDEWPEYRVTYHYGSSCYVLHVVNARANAPSACLDGRLLSHPVIPLVEDGKVHHVRVELP